MVMFILYYLYSTTIFSGKAYGPLYNWLGNFDFVKAYGTVTAIIIACGVIMLAFTKKFDRMVEGE